MSRPIIATARWEALPGAPEPTKCGRWVAESPTMGVLGIIGDDRSNDAPVIARLRDLCAQLDRPVDVVAVRFAGEITAYGPEDLGALGEQVDAHLADAQTITSGQAGPEDTPDAVTQRPTVAGPPSGGEGAGRDGVPGPHPLDDLTIDEYPTTYRDAREINAFTLARMYGDLPRVLPLRAMAPPTLGREARYELVQLAVMCSLGNWISGWVGSHIHAALLNGATIEQLVGATGMDEATIRARWSEWVPGQLRLRERYPSTHLGVDQDARDRVRRIFQAVDDREAAAGHDRARGGESGE